MVSVQFFKKITGPLFCGEWIKRLLTDISFESGLQNFVLSSLLLFPCYLVDLDDIQWNEVASSTTRNFINSWPLHLNFLNMANLCPNISFIKNKKCDQFFFEKRAVKKTKNFHIFKGSSFCNGEPYCYECWRVLRDFCGLSNKCCFATFPKI